MEAKSSASIGTLISDHVVWLLPLVLSTTAGAVDVIGFLPLGGLFTAHITGILSIGGTGWNYNKPLALVLGFVIYALARHGGEALEVCEGLGEEGN